MEHSLLHGLQLCGLVVALGGAFFVLALLVMLPGLSRGQKIRFATQTSVGRIGVWRAFILALVACFGGSRLLGKWWCVAAFGSVAALLSGLVSHSAAVPTGRTAAIVAQVMHIVMGSLWIGVLVHFLACRRLFASTESAQTGKLVTRILARFSPFALWESRCQQICPAGSRLRAASAFPSDSKHRHRQYFGSRSCAEHGALRPEWSQSSVGNSRYDVADQNSDRPRPHPRENLQFFRP